MKSKHNINHPFDIDREKLYALVEGSEPTQQELDTILSKARELKGLNLEEVAALLRVKNHDEIYKIMDVAKYVKEEIYGKRLVIFAPLYTGNVCVNNCTYCAFRKANKVENAIIEAMRAFADATHTLRASHGQAPAAVPDDFLSHKLAWREAIAQCGLAVSADDPDRSYWEHELRAFDRAYSELASITPQADSVQEDAALWHWLAEYLVGTRTDLDDEIVASETVNDLRKLVEAARKQGEKQ